MLRPLRIACLSALLGALPLAGAQAQLPRVVLDHAFVIVDDATFEAVADDDWLLDQLAGARVSRYRNTDGAGWTGAYFFGPQTYIEILQASSVANFMPMGVGGGGLGWAVEGDGDLTRLQAALEQEASAVYQTGVFEVPRSDGGTLGYFHRLQPMYPDSGVTNPGVMTWFMEYHDDVTPDGDKTRAAQRARDHQADRLLGDITVLHAELSDTVRNLYVDLLTAAGFAHTRTAQYTQLRNDELSVRIYPLRSARPGLRTIEFAVTNAPTQAIDRRIGASRLQIGTDGGGVWHFPWTQGQPDPR